MLEGRPIILDEANLADQNVIISLNPIFDSINVGQKVIVNGKEIKPKD
jgi:midasin (ATPase involved in ribosome maturation)